MRHLQGIGADGDGFCVAARAGFVRPALGFPIGAH
eukprot:CAMPEP_0175771848 /NCGR_PEP_ID=MMETSP0097-20121207/72247_1 /TAXON_ID=311494 /ORGANISM="Alexandrium monilatum, Strain CCMP3105" /LENGTH=34 /DNA_ID= /DNA_START= /DNA_END= /DNA_ORIENTATION=